jgi:hypothetical protein
MAYPAEVQPGYVVADIWYSQSKEEGVSGKDVKALYTDRRFVDIARYCARDLRATKELFSVWDLFIKPA